MISICIPIYNFDITNLIGELSKQAKLCDSPVELVLIDDYSDDEFKEINDSVCKEHKYIELNKNIGRSKIRNLFLDYVSYDCLLFLDCDSLIVSDSFIEDYISAYNTSNAQVICGGRVYERTSPSRSQRLSWVYGVKRESKSYTERQQQPYSSFMTNNFLVHAKVLKELPFDECLSKYGHEDTLFGFYLQQNSKTILHINNVILNGDIENNEEYLNKTNLAIENLVLIISKLENKKGFVESISLLSFHQKLKKYQLLSLVLFLAPIINIFFLLLLKSGIVNLTLFNYYKLNYLSKVLNKKKS